MRRLRLSALCVLLLALIISWTPARASLAGEPTDQVKQTVDRVLEIVRNKELKKPSKTGERRAAIRKVIGNSFDFAEMAKRSMALHWKDRTPAEQKEFIPLFTDLLERSYIKKIEGYEDEKILYTGESVEGQNAAVKSKIVTKTNTEIPLEYRLQKDSKWEVYDVVIEGVSLVNNYRTQFNKIIRKESYEALVKKLKNRQDELSFEEKK